jgi:hypothetical protein
VLSLSIVSAKGHPTEKISEFVDFRLRPHVEALSSHLKDTTDYLLNMESMNPLPSILFSMDVMSLYTNILHNDVAHEGAIVVPIAVPLICIICSPLNVKLLRFSINVSNWTRPSVGDSLKALSWSRVIDDIDMKWTESKENLHRFFDNTNNVHSTIKFTHKTSRTNIWMLTIPVKMVFDIYNKPTDEHPMKIWRMKVPSLFP